MKEAIASLTNFSRYFGFLADFERRFKMSSDDKVFSEDSLEYSFGSDIFLEPESTDLEELFDSNSGDGEKRKVVEILP